MPCLTPLQGPAARAAARKKAVPTHGPAEARFMAEELRQERESLSSPVVSPGDSTAIIAVTGND